MVWVVNIEVGKNLSYDELARILAKGGTVTGTHRSRARRYAHQLNDTMRKYRINTNLRQAHFLAQIMHESAGFRYTKELWGPTPQQKKYDPPYRLASRLGNKNPGDGFKYRGRGFIQLTGKFNYEKFSESVPPDVVRNPDLVASIYTSEVAGWYWDKHDLNLIADRDDLNTITRKINGGYNGIADRRRYLKAAKGVLNV